MSLSFHNLQKIVDTIHHAESPRLASEALVQWLGDHVGSALIALLNRQTADLEIHPTPGFAPSPEIIQWIQSPDSWLIWETWGQPYWLDMDHPLEGLNGHNSALIVPLYYEQVLQGILWLDYGYQKQESEGSRKTEVMLLGQILSARLHHLHNSDGWQALLTNINEFNQGVSQKLSNEELWEMVYQQISSLFDTTSFFAGLLNPNTQQLALPMVVQYDMMVYYGSLPLAGLSKALVQHGITLYFRDLDAEQERLASLEVELSADQPGWGARSWLGVPLRSSRGEIIGLISIQNELPGHFTDPDISLLTFIASHISRTLENRQLLLAEQERRQVASTLIEVSQVVSSTLHYEEVLERILEQLHRVTEYDRASIMLPVSSANDELRMIISASQGEYSATKGRELLLSDKSLGRHVIQAQQPMVIGDVFEHVHWGAPDIENPDQQTRSWLGVPMLTQNRVIGLITMEKFKPYFYNDDDANTAFALARQAAIAVENARLHAEAEQTMIGLNQRAQRLAAIHRISLALGSTLERDVILQTAARLATELFACDYCSILLIQDADEIAEVVVEYPEQEKIGMRASIRDNAIFERLFQDKKALALYAPEADDSPILHGENAQATLLAPLIARKRVIGCISLNSTRGNRVFSQEEHEMGMTIAAQVALAINNAQLYEEALAANHLKMQFLANVSHELRTPLNAIIGYSELLLTRVYGDLTEKQFDRLMRVNQGGKHLLGLINDVLDLSKIEAGEMTLEMVTLSPVDSATDSITDITPQAEAKGLKIYMRLPSDLPLIQADGQRLRQILTNLLDNAVKFTESGSVTLEVSAVSLHDGVATSGNTPPHYVRIPDGDWVEMVITDTGIGIDTKNLTIIFEAFRQADGSSIRKYEGTGLGLTITLQLVKLHGGFIWVESSLGSGSTFTVLLPVSQQSDH